MYMSEFVCTSFWWIFPVVMMVFCFLMMRRGRGSMMCGFTPHSWEARQSKGTESATEVLAKRYAAGEINQAEYQEIEATLAHSTEKQRHRYDDANYKYSKETQCNWSRNLSI